MMLGGFGGVVVRMFRVSMRNVGVMASLLVIPGFVMLGRFTMMFSRVLVMLGCLVVVLSTFVC
jgi:hypothetical protein